MIRSLNYLSSLSAQVLSSHTLHHGQCGTKVDEFVQWCLNRCAPLSLHAHLLQLLTQCTSIEQKYSIACKVVVHLDEANVSYREGGKGRKERERQRGERWSKRDEGVREEGIWEG